MSDYIVVVTLQSGTAYYGPATEQKCQDVAATMRADRFAKPTATVVQLQSLEEPDA
jgi:hypothetical protein